MSTPRNPSPAGPDRAALDHGRRALDRALSRDRGRLHGLWSRWQGKPADAGARQAFEQALTASIATRERRLSTVPAVTLDDALPIAREGDRIVKKVAAGPGDKVLIQGTELWINDKHADRLWLANSLEGKKAGDFDTRLELEEGQYFLMGTTKESFDSRYWGIVQSESIIGRALPLF